MDYRKRRLKDYKRSRTSLLGSYRNDDDHITPVLKSLHWLRVEQRILYKLIVLTFKAIHGIAPSYLSELVQVYEPKRSLRLKNRQTLLVLPKYNTTTYGKRAFKIGAPTEWNKLPENLRTITDFEHFKRELKTFLFRISYDC